MIVKNSDRTYKVFASYDKRGFNLVLDIQANVEFYLPMSIISEYERIDDVKHN